MNKLITERFMKHFRIATGLIPAAIVLLSFSSCTEGCPSSGISDISLENRLYPTNPVPTESLVVADLSNDDIEGQIAAIGLQGIVNRTEKQKIYVIKLL